VRQTGALVLLVLLAAVLATAAAGPSAARARGDARLERKLAKALAGRHLGATRAGAVAFDLATGELLFAQNASLPLAPASNEKLALTFALLHTFTPTQRLETRVLAAGTQDGTTLDGRLVLVGGGDPTLSSRDLRGLARRVRALGIRRVTRGVVGDESLFDAERTVEGWKPSYYMDESPPLSALVVDRSQFRKRMSSKPARAAAFLFREALRAEGVEVGGVITVGRAPAGATLVTSTRSGPLSSLIRFMDVHSDNFFAEQLLKYLALSRYEQGTSAGGARVVTGLLREAGVPMAGLRIVDGSGLSLEDRLSAGALVGILQAIHAEPELERLLVHSLAVAGQTGTLKHRMRTAPLYGHVVAKTGTTSIASSLAGYINGHVAFAIVQNASPIASWWAREAQDRFAAILAKRG
jgi:D-alanyl-D-alanine carboxypeptidase/D-alanyl-D-alanine-endopeptidase (penicillin-binding protein 4)